MPGSLTMTRRGRTAPTRSRRGSDIPQLHQLQRLNQTVGNRAVGQLAQTAVLPTATAMKARLAGGRTFGRSKDQKRLFKWLNRWHGGIGATSPGIKLSFLEGFRAIVSAYRDDKADKATTTDRTNHIAALNTLLFEIDTVRQQAQADYDQTDDLPGLSDLDGLAHPTDLRTYGDAERLGAGGLNSTYTVKVDTSGTEMVFKAEKAEDEMYGMHRGTAAGIPKLDPNQTGRAVGTYRMAQLMGLEDVVPATYYATYDGHGGQIMGLVQGVDGFQLGVGPRHTRAHGPDRNRIFWLDLVCGQVDRHGGNFMLETDGSGDYTGRAFAIDNDLAFGEHYGIDPKKGTSRSTARDSSLDINGKEARRLHITPELAERIIRLSRNATLVRGALHGLLTTNEIDATITRLENLAAYLTRRLAKRERITGWT